MRAVILRQIAEPTETKAEHRYPPPQVNPALDGFGYVEAGKLSTPIWEFEGGKAYDTEDTAYLYSVNDSVLSITVDDTVYTYTVSDDKKTLTNGQKTTGNSDPVPAEYPSLTRNLAGLTYESEEIKGGGSPVTLTFKTRGNHYLERDGNNVTTREKKYTVTDAGVVTIPTSNNDDSTISYTLSEENKRLKSNQTGSYSRDLILLTDAAAE